MRSRKLLALIFSLLAIAPALAGYMTLLGAGVGSIQPVASWVSTTDPTFPSSSLTFSRTSLATMFDSTGKLTYAPNNLLTQSNTFSDAIWAKSGTTVASGATDRFGGTSAWTVTATGANGQLYQGVTGSASTNYIPAIWVKRRTGTGNIKLYNPSAGAATIIAVDNTWKQFAVPGVGAGSTYCDLLIETIGDAVDVSEATLSAVTYETSPRTADQVITTSAAYYGPRIDYDPNTLAVKGLLIEEARTNSTYPSIGALSGGTWTLTSLSYPSTTTGIDGVSGSAAKAVSVLGQSAATAYAVSKTASNTGVVSAYAKPAGYNYLLLIRGLYADGDWAIFDVNSGTVAQSPTFAGSTAIIRQGPNGYWYCELRSTQNTNINAFSVSSAANNSATANGTDGIYITEFQTELGATFGTSRIRTSSASVTRAADVVQFTGAALTALQGSAGSFIYESDGHRPTTVFLGSGGSPLGLYSNGNDLLSVYNGTNTLKIISPTIPATSNWRGGVAWAASARSLSLNGGTVAKDAFAFGTFTNAYLGSNGSAFFINQHVRSFGVYNQKLPDATLQAKSVVGASYAANDNANPFAPKFAANDNLPVHWRIAL